MIAPALFVLVVQANGWIAAPSRPTVGDTIQLERTVTAPPGWRIRAGRLASATVAEPLGDAVVVASSGNWVVRYAVVAWTPGEITLDMPPLWRLGPDGTADSLAGGTATFHVASVIPDSVRAPAPQPSLGPLRLDRSSPIPVIAALLLAGGTLLLLIAWRRRGPRVVAAGAGLAVDPEVADARWLAAGEPKAVAARAAQRLRRAVAHAVPDAHEALSTEECLAALERARPDAPLRDLRELLVALDQVAFATAHGVEVAPLAARARALARELHGNGARR
ncbi:MAG: hypothetical protein DMD59_04565 [Gemmatimonadetes bacterium]|nr:MAG: hypothetical protein DMD59_04565 [Gemmatimonadota bacterium]